MNVDQYWFHLCVRRMWVEVNEQSLHHVHDVPSNRLHSQYSFHKVDAHSSDFHQTVFTWCLLVVSLQVMDL